MMRVLDGTRLMSDYLNDTSKSSQIPSANENYTNELNTFYNRFQWHDFSAERRDLRDLLENPDNISHDFVATENEVRCLLLAVNSTKAAGQDRLSPRSLKSCASQLTYIFTSIFNLSLITRSIHALWKQFCTYHSTTE